ncbi:L-ribulose-5-phosphate 4-epimerase [Rahnella bonaserana]|jgi:L-ribulose-5-phosphate 4-epimerase|uniref:L-ribulose-5-phosphate 4-epimerase n=1 Tax=Rahnella bonaserana TaxID=2816248 RepID=UPI0024C2FBAB|nr:L-ribulose-5-phosphate 4-epimerase [Rahnella bonaserana]MCL9644405.1 L-ribulose-5-phosphate 4-epimerase [Rahnella victoriana]WHZ40925.1 L-ribulose-5-phosphate 4-epimerase [Rahnella bonaserana]
MTDALKQRVFEANMALPAFGLVTFTWGNVSGIDRERGLIAIKPSGVEYETMQASDMVVLNLQGEVVEGHYKPSSDTATHLELYARFPQLGGIVHTHSTYATSWAQAGVSIPPLGTTHADYFAGAIPCTRPLSTHEVNGEYELETGKVIAASLTGTDPLHMPGILVAQHGPFCWGTTPEQAVHNAVVLEEVAKMAWITGSIRRNQTPMDDYLLQKHFSRKHGPDAYYGQK